MRKNDKNITFINMAKSAGFAVIPAAWGKKRLFSKKKALPGWAGPAGGAGETAPGLKRC
jgi:hypothetical protein